MLFTVNEMLSIWPFCVASFIIFIDLVQNWFVGPEFISHLQMEEKE